MNDSAIATFQQALRGRLVHPTDADYDAVRALYNGMNRCPKIELFRPFWKPRLNQAI